MACVPWKPARTDVVRHAWRGRGLTCPVRVHFAARRPLSIRLRIGCRMKSAGHFIAAMLP